MKKYRINDILSDSTAGGQQTNGQIDRHLQQAFNLGQRLQMYPNIQNRIQRRYEADGSEEEEMQRQNQLLITASLAQQSLSSAQRNMNNGSAEDIGTVANGPNIDANSLFHKLKELQEAEQRLKQVEDLMRSIEKMENNIKEAKRESMNDTRPKTSNEVQTKFITRNNVSKPQIKSASTQPKHLPHSANNMSTTNPQKNVIPRNIEENNVQELNVNPNANSSQHLLPQAMDFCDNNLGYSTDVDESESNSEESFNLINGNLIRSMRSQFDSMRSQFESMFPVLENQFTNGNHNIGSNVQNSSNNPNNYMNNQFFHLMLLQNYQILQQQQMLLLWLQQQQQQNQGIPVQPMPDPSAQRMQNHNSHPYMNGTHNAMPSMAQNSIQFRNSIRNNESNAHPMTALNNQVVPGVRANNYYDNFKSYSRPNKLTASANRKANENLLMAQNQMVSPLMAGDQQMVHNANHYQEPNPLSPNSSMMRQQFGHKAANAGHGSHGSHCVEHVEKQQNLPQFNDLIANKVFNSESGNFAALFSMLEKLIETDDKYKIKSVPKKKSTNLVISSDNEEEYGAVGGVGVSNVSNQISPEESIEGSNKPQTSGSNRSQHNPNMSVPLHIPASSGAIRKKPRNHEILELSSKAENSEGFGKSLVNGSELIRPLMAAEGRSCETGIVNSAPTQSQKGPSHQILSVRPPTTGAPPYDCDSDASNASSDDELAEADQTVTELIAAEPEVSHINSNINANPMNTVTAPTNTLSAQAPEPSHRSSKEDVSVTNDILAEEEEDDEEDNLLTDETNEGGIRLSGDGEQGL